MTMRIAGRGSKSVSIRRSREFELLVIAGLDPAIHRFRRWMPEHRRAEATPFFERLCPGMTTFRLEK
jgi:hypothetical protein